MQGGLEKDDDVEDDDEKVDDGDTEPTDPIEL